MKSEPLTNEDRKILISELSQLILAFVFAGIVVALVLTTGIIILNQSANELIISNRTGLTIVLIGLTVTTLIIWGWIKLKNPVVDLIAGKKLTREGIVIDKTENTNYGWHGNVGADIISQPKLIECFLNIDNVS